MESRKYQLQKQIIEALKANDNDLYVLLKSQWAHRFGVESLEELKDLDLKIGKQKQINEDSDYESQNNLLEVKEDVLMKEDDKKEKEIIKDTNKLVKSVDVESKELFEINSYRMIDKENDENKIINPIREFKSSPKVEALIPLPPKPKYSFLKKWLLKS